MKSRGVKPIVTFLALVLSSALWGQEPWEKIPIPRLPAFHPQEPKRIELANGMVIFLEEDHELPTIDAIARIRGGSRAEPAEKTGLVSIYGEVWRTGGTRSRSGDELDDYLEVRAAKVETAGNEDSTTIGLSCLKENFAEVFRSFHELMMEPEFREEKLDLAKHEAFDAISRRNDEVSDIAHREAIKLAYGANNPYARVPEYATVAAITRQDLIDWHRRYVHPNNTILGIVGDFDSATMEALLRKSFGDWAKGERAAAPEIRFQSAKPGYYLIKKTDVNQSAIRMVELGTRRDNPDYYAIEVFNEAFGGGFSSRLVQTIRTAKGLAYGVGGGIGARFDHPGILQLAMGTKSASTVESIQALYGEIERLQTAPISNDEIKRAKDSILNAFVFNFDTPDKIMRERMAYEFYAYPADFLERYRAGIEKVSAQDVARIIPKYLHKDQLAVLVVGNTAEFDKPLSSLGAVTNIDITIPPPPGEPKPAAGAPAGSNPEGKRLAARVVEALGGRAQLAGVKAVKSKFSVKQANGAIQAESTILFPDHVKVNLSTPQGNLTLVVGPESGFLTGGNMGVQDLPSSRKEETLEQIHRDLIYLGQHVDDPAFSFVAAGKESGGSAELEMVDVSGPGVSLRWFVDPQSGKIVRETYKAMGQGSPVDSETDFSDWKPVAGLNLPFRRENKQNGQPASTAEFSTIELNPAIDQKIFERPASQ